MEELGGAMTPDDLCVRWVGTLHACALVWANANTVEMLGE